MRSSVAVVLACAWLAGACGDVPRQATDGGAAIDGAGNDAAVSCTGLDRDACARTDGCVITRCDACGCEPTFHDCRPVGAPPPTDCPALGCPSPICCGDTSQCSGDQQCQGPDEPAGCGICMTEPSPCTDDASCLARATGVTICEPITCGCTGADRRCVAGCEAGDCESGQSCDVATGRCVGQACGAGTPCPADFDCVTGACARRECTTDAQCDDFCVEGLCYVARGVCTGPSQ